MKNLLKISLLVLLGISPAWCDTLILVDPTTLNGSFESGTANVPSNWQTGLTVTEVYRQVPVTPANTAPDGSYVLTIGRNATTNYPGGLLNTGYNVKSADTFNFSFQWDDSYNWDTNDPFNWRIFTTSDDTLAGTLTTIASGTITGRTTPAYPTATVLTGGGTVTGPNVGRDLWVQFYISSGNVTNDEYLNIDNVVLSVETIPEPSTAVLVCASLLAWFALRRVRIS